MQIVSIQFQSLGQDSLLFNVTQAVGESGCATLHIQANQSNGFYVGFIIVKGLWHQIEKLKACLDNLTPETLEYLEYQILENKSELNYGDYLPYWLTLYGLAQSEAIHQLLVFCQDNKILLSEITGGENILHITQNKVLSINAQIFIPISMSLADIRENFILFCDALNIDGMLEPERPSNFHF